MKSHESLIVLNRRMNNKLISNPPDTNMPIEVNVDTMRELKWTDRHGAYEMIKAFRENKKKNKGIEEQNFNKVQYLKKVTKHICTTKGCYNNAEQGMKRCKKCSDYGRKYKRGEINVRKKKDAPVMVDKAGKQV
jgi:hypothetical protein